MCNAQLIKFFEKPLNITLILEQFFIERMNQIVPMEFIPIK